MRKETFCSRATLIVILLGLFVNACSKATANTLPATAAGRPEWFATALKDARTGQAFTMNDFAGKVVLVETMAMWCPNCLFQANEVRKVHKLLGNPDDLVSVSLDVDLNEEEDALRDYVKEFGFEWRFAIAPLLVQRELANLYNVEYLNPPLSPMLVIDRDGRVHQLEYGEKSAETLKKSLEPYLKP